MQKTKLKNSKSFYDWCVENNKQDVLDRWDYELNGCSPKDICYGTGKKYWFKCDKHSEHKSELKDIRGFVSGKEGSMNCVQCNSFAQWCINHDRQDLLNIWDYELNNFTPWEVSYGSNKKCWFKCSKHPEHKSELFSITTITTNNMALLCRKCNSLAQYILDNFPDKDLYDIWDKEKNGDLDPWEISYRSSNRFWFKCQEKEYHGSYYSLCSNFTNGSRCPYCCNFQGKVHPKDSLGKYIIDNYGEEFLYVWSDKNKKSPFEYKPHSSKKVWWNCLDKKHNPFKRECYTSTNLDYRCPKCVEEIKNSTIEEKAKIYLEELGYNVLTEHNCTIRPINPKTRKPLPYDNEIILENGKHLIIEVHGGQHYSSGFYRTMCNLTEEEANKKLRQRQLYDRYKRIKCKQANYEYLEIPYYAFIGKNKNLYKELINNKINEILNISKTS